MNSEMKNTFIIKIVSVFCFFVFVLLFLCCLKELMFQPSARHQCFKKALETKTKRETLNGFCCMVSLNLQLFQFFAFALNCNNF